MNIMSNAKNVKDNNLLTIFYHHKYFECFSSIKIINGQVKDSANGEGFSIRRVRNLNRMLSVIVFTRLTSNLSGQYFLMMIKLFFKLKRTPYFIYALCRPRRLKNIVTKVLL